MDNSLYCLRMNNISYYDVGVCILYMKKNTKVIIVVKV